MTQCINYIEDRMGEILSKSMFLGHYIHRLDSPINELLMEQVLGVNGSDLHLLAAVWSSLNNTKVIEKRDEQ